MAVQAGQAWIQVNPSLRGWNRKVRQELAKELGNLNVRIPVEPDADWSSMKASAVREGADAGGSFAQAFRRRVDAALKALPDIRIGADTSEADTEIAGLRTRLQALRDLRIGVDIDAAQAHAEIMAIQQRLRQISGDDARVDVRADTGAAATQLAAIDAQVSRLDGREANVRVDVDRDGTAQRGVFFLSNQVNGLVLMGATIAPALVPAFGAVAVAAGGLASAIGSAGIGIGALVASVVPAFSAITQVTQAQEAADKSAATTAVQSSAQRVNAAYQAEQAARRVADARLAADRTAVDSARSVQDAQEAADRAAIDGARRVADAREQVARAQERAADMIAQAERRVENASAGVVRAQEAELRAQEALTEAREDAIRTLEDMRRLVRDLALDEQQAELALLEAQLHLQEMLGRDPGTAVQAAQLSLAEAQQHLNQVLADGTATDLEKAQAQLALKQAQEQLAQAIRDQQSLSIDQQQAALDVAEAENNLTDIINNQAQAQEDLAAAEAAGIDGMDQVVSAQEALQNATQGVTDALASQREAQAELADVQIDAARTVADAQQQLARAQEAAARANEDAQSRVAQAQEQAARANADAARAVSDALAAQAQQAQQANAQMDAGSAAARNLAYALGELTPMQRQLLAGWTSLKDAFSAWAESLEPHTLPPFIAAFQLLEDLLPHLSPIVIAVADALGVLVGQASAALDDPFWQDFFGFLAAEAGPNTLMFGQIIGNLAKAFAGLLMAFAPVARDMMEGLVGLTKRFADWSAGLSTNNGFQNFIDYVLDLWPQLKATLSAMWGAFRNLIDALAPLAGPMLGLLENAFQFIADMDPGLLAGIAAGLVSIGWAFKSVGVAMAVLNANPIIVIIAAVAGLATWLVRTWQTNEEFRDKVTAVWKVVQGALGAAWGFIDTWVIRPFMAGLSALWNVAIAVKDGIVWAFNLLGTGLGKAKDWLLQNVIVPVGQFFQNLWNKAVQVKDGIVGAWGDMMHGLGVAKDWIAENIISPIRNFFQGLWNKAVEVKDGIVGAFQDLPQTVGNIFSTIADFLLRPVRTVIGWINDHMIGNLNKVTGLFGLTIPNIPVPGASNNSSGGGGGGNAPSMTANTGGLVPGSGPDRDSVHAYLTPGEGIIKRSRMNEIAAGMGMSPSKAIGAINSGIDPSARGGAFDFIGNIASGAWNAISSIGSQVGSWLKDGAAFAIDKIMTPIVSGVPHVIPGPELVQDFFRGTLAEAKKKMVDWAEGKDKESEGTAPGKAPGGVPDMSGGSWAFPLPRGSYRVGRGTAGHGYPAVDFPAPAGVPIFAPFAGRLVQKSMATSYGKHSNIYAGNTRVILAHASSLVGGNRMVSKGELVGRVGTTGNSTGNHLHAEVRQGGRGQEPRRFWKYDQGGYLPQGLTLAFNATGQRERILDPAETRAYESMSGYSGVEIHTYGTPRGLTNQVAMDLHARRQLSRPLINH